jgi:hypothetical protein
VEERHEIGVVKPGTTRRAALKSVFVYICQEGIVLNYMLKTGVWEGMNCMHLAQGMEEWRATLSTLCPNETSGSMKGNFLNFVFSV